MRPTRELFVGILSRNSDKLCKNTSGQVCDKAGKDVYCMPSRGPTFFQKEPRNKNEKGIQKNWKNFRNYPWCLV